LEKNTKPVTGCTEPAAIAYAAAAAGYALCGRLPPHFSGSLGPVQAIQEIVNIEIVLDRNVYKNAGSAIIPGMGGCYGPAAAAAAGVFLDPRDGLDLFSRMTPDIRSKATVLALSDRVSCATRAGGPGGTPDISVLVTRKTSAGSATAKARITSRHDHISYIHIGNTAVYRDPAPAETPDDDVPDSIRDLVRVAESMDSTEAADVYRGVEMNMDLYRACRDCGYGLRLGEHLRKILPGRDGSRGLVDSVRIAAAYAADARMGGAPFPVMSTAGSGNQGITALIPVGVVGESCSFSKEEIARAALISHMVTKQADRYTGRLSALCGCSIKAGIGAAAGVTYLLGGGEEEISTAINLLVANITGTICDGAKPGCALKIATAAGLATECALLATGGMKISAGNGIVRRTAGETIQALAGISRAMAPVDAAVIRILEERPSGL